ncbi:alpha-ketoglutarate-dependent 2,4-dichlorophenoxyacetate dioxygenase [Colletotrichum tofieldiae]|uniref:Alpha-ketoglutarate-dependent 2,4-dichlorophenoxyacetate dioxygenase n=1 Tax=Colletotrichum tofieldiae TaxID=708197 RepID=A0A166T6K3_9PEZI|nr:alpha-ketoglutarate-dependent 2,4-dichlorophenoxyacetate dioxygenase [Colletotrichum tofieldiae]GKT93939.1 alpha-ketoglutarate-dependent 2,4-dichlorophenoxyacetate dioxygenase [Colletotrichum tofieldiae]
MATSSSNLEFKPLSPTFGAECFGMDFSQPVPESTIGIIRDAMTEYGFLLFRQTALDDTSHVAFAKQFGPLEDQSVWIHPEHPYRLPFTELADSGNVEADGVIVSRNNIRQQINMGNMLWHVDSSYNPRRAGFSILLAHETPLPETGAATLFADSRTAYDDLDSANKARVAELILSHSLWHSRKLGAPESAVLGRIKPEKYTMARHKVAQLHQPSGRMNLYIAAHGHHFDGMTLEESKPILNELLRHVTQDKYTVKIDWKTAGDMVMWDNTCTLHRGEGGSCIGKYARDLRRATVMDQSSLATGLNGDEVKQAGIYAPGFRNTKWCDGTR